MRKTTFCICENKDADQLRSNCEVDQRLCFRYISSTIPLLPKSEISSLYSSSVAVQPGLCQNLVGNPIDRFSHNEAQISDTKTYGITLHTCDLHLSEFILRLYRYSK